MRSLCADEEGAFLEYAQDADLVNLSSQHMINVKHPNNRIQQGKDKVIAARLHKRATVGHLESLQDDRFQDDAALQLIEDHYTFESAAAANDYSHIPLFREIKRIETYHSNMSSIDNCQSQREEASKDEAEHNRVTYEHRSALMARVIPQRTKRRRVKLVSTARLRRIEYLNRCCRWKIRALKKKQRGYDNPSLAQAQSREDWPLWEAAIASEYKQMVTDGVYVPCKGKPPPDANLIGSMLVLVIKRHPDGRIDKYKARLVALGNQQTANSYDQIKSGTARSAAVKMLISLQAKTAGLSMVLDVKGAYLKSHIVEEDENKLYLRLPSGDIVQLKKYLYGLKQAGYHWQMNITGCLLRLGYEQSTADPLVFSRRKRDEYIVMVLHVDDFYCVSSNADMLATLHTELTNEYGDVSIKSGDLLSYLGMAIRICQKTGRIFLTQPGYVQKLLNKFNELGKKSSTPMPVTPLTKRHDDKSPVDQTTYLQMVGALNFLAQCTRADMLYSLSMVAQECAHPTGRDRRRVQRIFEYLANTQDYGICFEPGPIQLSCWVDASFNCYADGKGHFGYGFSLGLNDAMFYAKSQKMKLVTLSSTEAEYVALCEAATEVVWLRRLLRDIGFAQDSPTIVYEDNKSCIDMVNNRSRHQASKHINPKYHFVRAKQQKKVIDVQYISTNDQLADLFTKALGLPQHQKLTDRVLNRT